MIRTEKRMRLCVALTVCCLVFIWGNSLLPGDISGAISDFVKKILERLFTQGEPEPENGGFLVRKLAHFTEFTMLGLCLCWLFGMLGKGKLLPFLCGAAAACVDETIQIFVPGRGPGVRDVCIDSCGVLLGVILLTLGHHYLCKKQPLEET
ncbi:MAG: VanZ family protein [Eubacteriales bacterium]|nr:VanZ family protein [Eubacteriales bacterium]